MLLTYGHVLPTSGFDKNPGVHCHKALVVDCDTLQHTKDRTHATRRRMAPQTQYSNTEKQRANGNERVYIDHTVRNANNGHRP